MLQCARYVLPCADQGQQCARQERLCALQEQQCAREEQQCELEQHCAWFMHLEETFLVNPFKKKISPFLSERFFLCMKKI
jgi:hypothetical protein